MRCISWVKIGPEYSAEVLLPQLLCNVSLKPKDEEKKDLDSIFHLSNLHYAILYYVSKNNIWLIVFVKGIIFILNPFVDLKVHGGLFGLFDSPHAGMGLHVREGVKDIIFILNPNPTCLSF